MCHLADALTAEGGHPLPAGPRFRRVSVGDVKATPRRLRTRSSPYSAREGQASVDLRDFESILFFFSEEEIEKLQVAIEERRSGRLVLDKERSLNPAEPPDYSFNLVEDEVLPEDRIQHPT